MFGLGRQMFLFGIIVFVFSINLTAVAALKCRAGVDNSVGIVYWQETCDASQQACFKSVKCYTIGDASYVDVDWRCIERSKCMNVTGKYVAYYKNVRGRCCFTNNCNVNFNADCTQNAAIDLRSNWMLIMLSFSFMLTYIIA